jgi:pyrimidine operon attenuation protein / uracil phosphoribosyltransferase
LTGAEGTPYTRADLSDELTRKARILDADRIRRMVDRMAHEIAERQKDLAGLALIGIRTRGVPLANRLAARLSDLVQQQFPVGTLDITLYRDDLSTVAPQPLLKKTEIDFDLNGRTVLLCDDVLYTGRTIRAALDGVIDLGRPRAIRLGVLIDRGHREFPIEANYVGKSVPTANREVIQVLFQETDGADEVWILERAQ